MMGVLMLGLKLAGLLFGAALLLRIGIPAKNKERSCPRCRYEMVGVPGLRCPECGRTAKRERKLLMRPRRKRAFVLAALLLAIGYGGHLGGRALEDGWTTIVPSTVLIAAYPQIDASAQMQSIYSWRQQYYQMTARTRSTRAQSSSSTNSQKKRTADLLWFELANRASRETTPLWDWQRRWLLDRAIGLESQGEPMIRACGGWSAFSDIQRHRFIGLRADSFIQIRAMTPVGSPLYANVTPAVTINRAGLAVMVRLKDGEWVEIKRRAGRQTTPFMILQGDKDNRSALGLGIPTDASDAVGLELRISGVDPQFEWAERIDTNAVVQGNLDEVLPKFTQETIDQWLEGWATSSLTLKYMNRGDPNAPIESDLVLVDELRRNQYTQYGPSRQRQTTAFNAVLDVNLELLAGDQVIGNGRSMWLLAHEADLALQAPIAAESAMIIIDQPLFWDAIKSGVPLEIRMRSIDSDRSLRALYAKHRWEGSVTAPLGPTWAHNANPHQPHNEAEGTDPLPQDTPE